jgi:hypothetical protein
MLGALDARCRTVQFTSLLDDDDFERVAAFLAEYPNVELRAYGNYDGSIRNLEFLRFFPRLRKFIVQVWEIEDLTGLQHLPPDVDSLKLGATRSRRFSLGALTRFPNLKTLDIESHTKDIDAIGHLSALETLTLQSITLPDLRILTPLQRLQSLSIRLGGTTNLTLLPAVGQLKYLELVMVKGLSDIDAVGTIHTLQYLHLWAQRRVEHLPSFKESTSLRRVHIETLKGLYDLTPLCSAPELEEILLLDMKHLTPNHVQCLTRIHTLRRIIVGLGSKRKNDTVHAMLPLPAPDVLRFDFR